MSIRSGLPQALSALRNVEVIKNGTSQPFASSLYRVYLFSSPGIQDGTAPVPESYNGPVAPGRRRASPEETCSR